MKNCTILLAVLLVLSNAVLAQMQLKLSNDFDQQYLNTSSQNLESNLQLKLPEFSAPAPDAIEFAKGLMMLGILADVTFPMGGDEDFGHIAGTGFSGHVMFSYFISHQFMLAIRAGYIKFGTQTEEGDEQGYSYKYEDSFSQIPILLFAYYMIATKGNFKPYVGLGVGAFLQTYSFKWEESYFGQNYSLDESYSSTGFGIVPEVGFFLMLSGLAIQASAGYNLLLSDIPTADNEVEGEEYEEPSVKANSISVNVGVSFPIGGN